MKRILLQCLGAVAFGVAAGMVAMVLMARHAHAEDVYRGKDQYGRPLMVRLLGAPCAPEVTRWMPVRIKPEYHERFRAAVLTWGARDWKACWLEDDGDVYILDEEGVVLNQGMGMPRTLFRDEAI